MEHPPETKQNATPSRGVLWTTGLAFLAGGLITGIFNALHPLPGDTLEQTMQIILDAGTTFWTVDHLMLSIGLVLMAAGFAGIHRMTTTGPGAHTVRLGFYGLLVATAAWVVHFALDGAAWAAAIETWDAAQGESKETALATALLLRQITDATFPMTTVFYWSSLGVVGLGLARGTTYPRWLGWALAAIAPVPVALGIVAMFAGFSTLWDVLFATFATLTVVWALVAGVITLRAARRGGATT